jgi:glutamine synthetase
VADQQRGSERLRDEVFARAEQEQIRFVSLEFTDIMGIVKTVTIPYHKFGDAVQHGLWFDGSSVEGFARTHESDMFLRPDRKRSIRCHGTRALTRPRE